MVGEASGMAVEEDEVTKMSRTIKMIMMKRWPMAEKDEDEEEREGEAFIVKRFSDREREKRAEEERKNWEMKAMRRD